MKQNEIQEILKEKFALNNMNYRILLNGAWGIGKSYTWKLFVDEMNNDEKVKCIYVSLFGIQSISALVTKLKIEYLAQSNKKVGKIKQISETGIGKVTGMVGSIFKQKYIGGNIDILSLINLNFGVDYVVCFDDLERKSKNIDIVEIMGVIEEVGLNSKVLIVCNKDKMNLGDRQEFNTYKEKIIDYEYNLSGISIETIRKQVSDNLRDSEENKEALINFFVSYGNDNLRILKKIIDFLNEIIKKGVVLNSELIELCAAVIVEEYISGVSENVKEEDGKSKEYINPLLQYSKYKLSYRVLSLLNNIQDFYKYNKINNEEIANFVNPPIENEVVELLDGFDSCILKDENYIRENIERLKILFKEKEPENFVSVDYTILLVAQMRYYNEVFGFNIELRSIDELALGKIKMLIAYQEDDINLFRLENSIKTISTEFKVHVTDLIEDTLKAIKEYKVAKSNQKINGSFMNKDYSTCFQTLRNNPLLIKENLYIFDMLLNKCESEYYNNLRGFIQESLFMGHEDKAVLKAKLIHLKEQTQDKVAERRIDIVLKDIQEL